MFRSFYQRVLLLVVGLVILAQVTTFLAVLNTLDRDVRREMRSELERGNKLLGQMLQKRSGLLLNSAEVLAADYGFKSAIASRDPETIRSALSNNVTRVDADLASLISLDGRLISSTYSLNDDAAQYARIATSADIAGIHFETLVIADKARQIVVVPVKAPQTIAWLLLGFSLNDSLAEEMSSQLGMELSFSGQVNERTRYFGSTLSAEKQDALPRAMERIEDTSNGLAVSLQAETYLTILTKLDREYDNVSAILQLSLHSAMESYRRLRNRLLMLASLSLSMAIGLAFWFAHSVTRPMSMLSAAAARIRDGNYKMRLDLQRRDEFGQLADTFNRMQAGIAEREERIVHQAFHDELTQLPNLRLGRDRLQQQIAISHRRHETIAVIVAGIDRFKQVNETLGHPIGDRLLQQVSARIEARIRQGDTVARVSSDEFLIVAANADQVTVRKLVDDLILQVSEPVSLDAAELIPNISVGVALFPHHGSQAGELIRRANIALTDARETMSPLHFYEFGRDEKHLRQLSLVADLKRAVDEDQLIMHYQPKIDMHNSEVYSVEALVRWIHPEHGFMPPDEFIGLAEKSGNISMLSNWVMRTVIAQLAAWRVHGITVNAAVNLSAMDLQDDSLPDRIGKYLKAQGLGSDDLIIEVTESAMMRDANKAMTVLRELRDRGLTVSIDDFGTGYSSLAKLRDLPIKELKIDRSFIIDIKPDTTDALIVKAIIELGHSMNMSITTEGVETQTEWNLLKALGSDTVQGYYISRPLPPEDFAKWWQEHSLQLQRKRAA